MNFRKNFSKTIEQSLSTWTNFSFRYKTSNWRLQRRQTKKKKVIFTSFL